MLCIIHLVRLCTGCIFMEKIIERNILFDFYGELLTEHQKSIYEDAVYSDLSLSELSEEYGITRQGVHDLLKRCDKILMGYENKLHLIEKFDKVKNLTAKIKQLTDNNDSLIDIRELSDEILGSL